MNQLLMLFLLSTLILLHEFGHLLMAKWFGIPLSPIQHNSLALLILWPGVRPILEMTRYGSYQLLSC